MFKEIRGICSPEEAQALAKITDTYPDVSVDIFQEDPHGTIVIFREEKEGVINAGFFGGLHELLPNPALHGQEEQVSLPINVQRIPVKAEISGGASETPAVSPSMVTLLWSRVVSLFGSGAKPLSPGSRAV